MMHLLDLISRCAACAVCVSALMLAGSPAFAEDPSLPDLTDSEMEEIHDGELHVEVDQTDSVNRGIVIGIVQEDIQEVTSPIARCWEYQEWRDSVPESGLIEQHDANNIVCSGTASTPFPARDRHGHFDVHNRTEDVEGTRSFVSSFDYIDDSGNLEDMFGYWLMYPYGPDDEHTLVKHVLNVDLGTWLPDVLINWATGRVLPNTILGLRNRVSDDVSEPLYWNDYDYD